jgi:hypothetical protein
MITHGTKKAVNIHTFLYPLYEELVYMATDGITFNDGLTVKNAKVHLLTFVGDIPAISELINHSGHTSKNGCRMCSIKGETGAGTTGGVFFPGVTTKRLLYTLENYTNGIEEVRHQWHHNYDVFYLLLYIYIYVYSSTGRQVPSHSYQRLVVLPSLDWI